MENLMNLSKMPVNAVEDAIAILIAYNNEGLPHDFYDDEVQLAYNEDSGMVFLTNREYEVAVLNEELGELESWYYTPYAGHEGTLNDLLDMFAEGEITDFDDLEYLEGLFMANNEFEAGQKVRELMDKMESEG